MNVTRDLARESASRYLSGIGLCVDVDVVILDENIEKFDCCWVFYYQSKKFIETGDRRFALLGNSPVLVDSTTGEAFGSGTAYPIEYYVNALREHRRS